MRSPLSLLLALTTLALALAQQPPASTLSSATTTLTSTSTTTLTRTLVLASPTPSTSSMNHTTAALTAASSGFRPSSITGLKSSSVVLAPSSTASGTAPESTATIGPYQALGAGTSVRTGGGLALLVGVVVGGLVF